FAGAGPWWGADFFEFVGDRIGPMVLFSQPDEVKVLPEEGGKPFSAGSLKCFHNNSSLAATGES
ncbi:MAG: hypothetical protein LBF75_09375, partial [Treponema sp.]|nr:hypothetical protein [Treponema sp.]